MSLLVRRLAPKHLLHCGRPVASNPNYNIRAYIVKSTQVQKEAMF